MATKKKTTTKAAGTKKTARTAATKKAPAKKPAGKKASAKKPAAKKSVAEAPKRPPRWSIGLFRNAKDRLCTVYVGGDGTPTPYEKKRVGDAKILFHTVYSGMKYSEARQQLLRDAAKAGVK